MCGIAGVLHLDGTPVDPQRVRDMLRELRPRGPDHEDCRVHGPVGLGYTRLAILDLSPAGRQPAVSDDGRTWLVYNGELYNFRALRRELEACGRRFRSTGDAEVVLQSYLEWGEACLARFHGMFALAVWDGRDGSLLLARDRLGIKPLYVARSAGRLLFASEIKALRTLPGVAVDLDPGALDDFLTLRFVPGPGSIWRDVAKVPPGTRIVVREGREEARRWWSFAFEEDESRSEAEWVDAFHALLTDVVRDHLVSDVPHGLFLSGGVDSTAIAGIARELGQDPIHTFCIGTGDDERPAARATAARLGTIHRDFAVEPADFDLLPRIVRCLDEPFGDAIVVPAFVLALRAAESVKMVLSGEGADEILGGYVHQKSLLALHRLERRLPRMLLALLGRAVGRLPIRLLDLAFRYPGSMGPDGRQRLGRVLAEAGDGARDYLNFVPLFDETQKRALVSPSLAEALRGAGERPWRTRLAENLGGPGPYLDRLIRQELEVWLPDNILFKQDRLTMGASLEARVPYVDHRVVEFCARVPVRWKLGRTEKHLLREVVERRLHPGFGRAKRPFFLPLTGAHEAPYRALIERWLAPDRIRAGGWWNPDAVSRLVASRAGSPLLRDKQIMALVLWEIWRETFGVGALH